MIALKPSIQGKAVWHLQGNWIPRANSRQGFSLVDIFDQLLRPQLPQSHHPMLRQISATKGTMLAVKSLDPHNQW